MSRASVLAAALSLRRFTVPEITPYCDEDLDAVATILAGCPGLLGSDGERWRVVDPALVREEIAVDRPTVATHRPEPPQRSQVLAARMLLAEETLLECGDEPSPEIRSTMASTAANHLRHVVATCAPTARPWWQVDLDRDAAEVELDAAGTMITPARVRVASALARMTSSEAAGAEVAVGFLTEVTLQVDQLPQAVDEPRLRALVDRFLDLAKAVAGPVRQLSGQSAAPARLVAALAWLRARVRTGRGVEQASEVLLPLFEALQDRELLAAHPTTCLYRELDTLPDGRTRVAVYADLLDLLPRQYACEPTSVLLPGVLIEAVADGTTSGHLQEWASQLEDDLVGSPFGSESALIGQTAHMLENLAVRTAGLDDSVIQRSDRTRTELLSLADVRV